MRYLALTALVATASLTACKDPAADAPKATVTDVKEAPATATPTPASAAAAAPATAPAAPAVAESLRITPELSKVGFVGSKVTASHEGAFHRFEGTIDLVDGKAETSRVTVEIETASVEGDSPKLTNHLKSDDFFAVEQFPKARFVSTSITPGGANGATHTIAGELELRGVKKQISFPATLNIAGDAVTAKAEFAINRKDFEIAYPGMADDLIRDDVLIKLDIRAPRGK